MRSSLQDDHDLRMVFASGRLGLVGILAAVLLTFSACTHSTTATEKSKASGVQSGATHDKGVSSGGLVPYANKPPVGQPVETH